MVFYFPQLYLAILPRWLPRYVLHPRANILWGVCRYWGRQVDNSGFGMLCHSFPRQEFTTQIWRYKRRVSIALRSQSHSLYLISPSATLQNGGGKSWNVALVGLWLQVLQTLRLRTWNRNISSSIQLFWPGNSLEAISPSHLFRLRLTANKDQEK